MNIFESNSTIKCIVLVSDIYKKKIKIIMPNENVIKIIIPNIFNDARHLFVDSVKKFTLNIRQLKLINFKTFLILKLLN